MPETETNNFQSSESVYTNFYQTGRSSELVILSERDVLAFIPEIMTKNASSDMIITRGDEDVFSSTVEVQERERVLLWARVSGGLVSGYRWVPYTPDGFGESDILPLREVFNPRVVYDKTSNTLHLWFWTNIDIDYEGTVYDESHIYPIGVSGYTNHLRKTEDDDDDNGDTSGSESEGGDDDDKGKPQCKRVLCYTKGSLRHWGVSGGFVGGYAGQPSSASESQFDLVPIFDRPVIINNYTDSGIDERGVGLVTDGWYHDLSTVLNHSFKPTLVSEEEHKALVYPGIVLLRDGTFSGVMNENGDVLTEPWEIDYSESSKFYVKIDYSSSGGPHVSWESVAGGGGDNGNGNGNGNGNEEGDEGTDWPPYRESDDIFNIPVMEFVGNTWDGLVRHQTNDILTAVGDGTRLPFDLTLGLSADDESESGNGSEELNMVGRVFHGAFVWKLPNGSSSLTPTNEAEEGEGVEFVFGETKDFDISEGTTEIWACFDHIGESRSATIQSSPQPNQFCVMVGKYIHEDSSYRIEQYRRGFIEFYGNLQLDHSFLPVRVSPHTALVTPGYVFDKYGKRHLVEPGVIRFHDPEPENGDNGGNGDSGSNGDEEIEVANSYWVELDYSDDYDTTGDSVEVEWKSGDSFPPLYRGDIVSIPVLQFMSNEWSGLVRRQTNDIIDFNRKYPFPFELILDWTVIPPEDEESEPTTQYHGKVRNGGFWIRDLDGNSHLYHVGVDQEGLQTYSFVSFPFDEELDDSVYIWACLDMNYEDPEADPEAEGKSIRVSLETDPVEGAYCICVGVFRKINDSFVVEQWDLGHLKYHPASTQLDHSFLPIRVDDYKFKFSSGWFVDKFGDRHSVADVANEKTIDDENNHFYLKVDYSSGSAVAGTIESGDSFPGNNRDGKEVYFPLVSFPDDSWGSLIRHQVGDVVDFYTDDIEVNHPFQLRVIETVDEEEEGSIQRQWSVRHGGFWVSHWGGLSFYSTEGNEGIGNYDFNAFAANSLTTDVDIWACLNLNNDEEGEPPIKASLRTAPQSGQYCVRVGRFVSGSDGYEIQQEQFSHLLYVESDQLNHGFMPVRIGASNFTINSGWVITHNGVRVEVMGASSTLDGQEANHVYLEVDEYNNDSAERYVIKFNSTMPEFISYANPDIRNYPIASFPEGTWESLIRHQVGDLILYDPKLKHSFFPIRTGKTTFTIRGGTVFDKYGNRKEVAEKTGLDWTSQRYFYIKIEYGYEDSEVSIEQVGGSGFPDYRDGDVVNIPLMYFSSASWDSLIRLQTNDIIDSGDVSEYALDMPFDIVKEVGEETEEPVYQFTVRDGGFFWKENGVEKFAGSDGSTEFTAFSMAGVKSISEGDVWATIDFSSSPASMVSIANSPLLESPDHVSVLIGRINSDDTFHQLYRGFISLGERSNPMPFDIVGEVDGAGGLQYRVYNGGIVYNQAQGWLRFSAVAGTNRASISNFTLTLTSGTYSAGDSIWAIEGFESGLTLSASAPPSLGGAVVPDLKAFLIGRILSNGTIEQFHRGHIPAGDKNHLLPFQVFRIAGASGTHYQVFSGEVVWVENNVLETRTLRNLGVIGIYNPQFDFSFPGWSPADDVWVNIDIEKPDTIENWVVTLAREPFPELSPTKHSIRIATILSNGSVLQLHKGTIYLGRIIDVKNSIEFDNDESTGDGKIQLVGDEESPEANHYYGTDGQGNRGFHPLPEDPDVETLGHSFLPVKVDDTNFTINTGWLISPEGNRIPVPEDNYSISSSMNHFYLRVDYAETEGPVAEILAAESFPDFYGENGVKNFPLVSFPNSTWEGLIRHQTNDILDLETNGEQLNHSFLPIKTSEGEGVMLAGKILNRASGAVINVPEQPFSVDAGNVCFFLEINLAPNPLTHVLRSGAVFPPYFNSPQPDILNVPLFSIVGADWSNLHRNQTSNIVIGDQPDASRESASHRSIERNPNTQDWQINRFHLAKFNQFPQVVPASGGREIGWAWPVMVENADMMNNPGSLNSSVLVGLGSASTTQPNSDSAYATIPVAERSHVVENGVEVWGSSVSEVEKYLHVHLPGEDPDVDDHCDQNRHPGDPFDDDGDDYDQVGGGGIDAGLDDDYDDGYGSHPGADDCYTTDDYT